MKKYKVLAICMCLALGLTACGTKETVEPVDTAEEVKEEQETTTTEDEQTATAQAEEEEVVSDNPKQIVVYFPNWNLGEKPAAHGGEVAGIPWDSVTYINHAFWAVAPVDDSDTQTSFERRSAGEEPRTAFKIISTGAKADYEDSQASEIDPSMERNHFAEYAVYSEMYPDVNIMISIGGWTACGFFSEMAYTEEGRKTFIQSCTDLMDQYTWIDGIDLDWEYPGGSNDGERKPEGDGDQGCPIWGAPKEDAANFASLVKEMRETFDEKYGEGTKKITACASSSTGWTLPNQDWVAAEPYVDLINIMTYDMAGKWDGYTGHAANINGVKGALNYFMSRDIPVTKLNIGTPLYATGFLMEEASSKPVGAKIKTDFTFSGDQYTIDVLRGLESESVEEGTPGWHFAFDKKASGNYLYNDDESSEFYNWFLSYESSESLQDKLDLINKYGLAGIIVWECSQDTADYSMIHQMADNLLK